ncbi:hypothetical protein BG74_08995 [Sodalis-like endosymbiont of Proechinophthirus fluctus]|nr:hypothetical protein BG74_08995 [Sodalis-like endosymbiont of Proechinophthirus fluctus]
MFGNYEAELVAFGHSALLDETHQQLKDSTANFVRRFLASCDCKPWLQTVAASITKLLPSEVENYSIETSSDDSEPSKERRGGAQNGTV